MIPLGVTMLAVRVFDVLKSTRVIGSILVTNKRQFMGVLHKATALSIALTLCLPVSFSSIAQASPMTLLGALSVNRSGASTYEISIPVPPGTADMVPSISMQYNSQGMGSTLGQGWSISGMSAVARCPYSLAIEGAHRGVKFDMEDRFCLEGQRLIVINGVYGADGAEYRTEVEGFSRIYSRGVAGDGPAWFEVQTKSGQTIEYGNAVGAQALAQGRTTPHVWAINKMTDAADNYISFTYHSDATIGELYPVRIDYTGNDAAGLVPYNSVRFSYETRPDIIPGYLNGSLLQGTVRLTNIQTYAGETMIADFRTSFVQSAMTGRTLLSEVEMCAGTGECFPGLNFDYTGTGFTYNSLAGMTEISNPGGQDGSFNSKVPVLIDINGDAKTDILFTNYETSVYGVDLRSMSALLSNSASYEIPNGFTLNTDFGMAWTSASNGVFGNPRSGADRLPDLNSDGYPDFFHLYSGNWHGSDETPELYSVIFNDKNLGISFATQQGSDNPVVWEWQEVCVWNACTQEKVAPDVSGDQISYFLDYDGDGIQDLFWGLENNNSAGLHHLWKGAGDGSFEQIGTFEKKEEDWIPNVEPTSGLGFNPSFYGCVRTADFNNDGLSDIFWCGHQNPGHSELSARTLLLSNGDGSFEEIENVAGQDDQMSTTNGHVPHILDVNGDGNADVFWRRSESSRLWISKGNGDFESILNPMGVNETQSGFKLAVADFNGDGLSDLYWYHKTLFDRDLWLSNGDGTFTIIDRFGGQDNTELGDVIQTADFNGDGKADLFFDNTGGNGLSTAERAIWVSDGQPADLLFKITTGLGAETEIHYRPLTDGNTYTKGTAATFPMLDVQSPLFVVSQLDADNGGSGVNSVAYHYSEALSDHSGRGWLGFREISITDLQTDIVKTTQYAQHFPIVGMATSVNKSLNGQMLNLSTLTYEELNLGDTRHFVALATSVTESWDLDGSAVPASTTTYSYDSYGNPTTVTVSGADGSSRITANTYVNDTTNWHLGRLMDASVTSTLDMTMPVITLPSVEALDDVGTTVEEAAITLQPLGNDVGSGLSLVSVTQPTNGVVVLAGNDLIYTPNLDFTGLDGFEYTLTDGQGGTSSANVSVSVSPVNDVPVALNDTVTVFESLEAALMPLDNDSDVDGDTLTITAVSAASNGTVTISPDNLSLLYTANAGYLGADSITYTISDGNGESATATLTLNVVDQPTPLVLSADSVTLDEDTSASITPLNNDVGDVLAVTTVTQGVHGAVAISSPTVVNYVPVSNYNGADSFTYTVTDQWGNTAVQTVSVTVDSINDLPVVVSDTVMTDQGVVVVIVPLENDTDVESAVLSISALTTPTNGTASIDTGSTSITYTPASGYVGGDNFNYTVIDGDGGSATGTITISVLQSNLLIARDALGNIRGPFTSENNGRYIKDAHRQTIFEADDRNDACSPVRISGGIAQIMPGYFFTGNGCEIAYDLSTPTLLQDASGAIQASFTAKYVTSSTTTLISSATRYALYKYVGSEDYCNSAAILKSGISFTGTGCELVYNPLETASIEVVVVDEDSSLTVAPLNENPVSGGIISAVSNASNGTVSLLSGTQITYAPDANYIGPDSFDYTVTGGPNGDVQGTISVVINPVNDLPVPGEDLISTAPDTAVSISVLENDTDIDGDTLSVTAVSVPIQGTAALNSAGTEITYTPAAGYLGVDNFTYTLEDGKGGSVTGIVQIAVETVSPNLVAINSLGGVIAPFTLVVANNGMVRVKDANNNYVYRSTVDKTLCDAGAVTLPGYSRSGRGCELTIDPTVPTVVQDASGVIDSTYNAQIFPANAVARITSLLGTRVYQHAGASDFCNTAATIKNGFSFTGNGCEFVYSP